MAVVLPAHADPERTTVRVVAPAERPLLQVVAEHALVGDAVARAVAEHGLAVRVVDWDAEAGGGGDEVPATVGLLLTDLETVDAVLRARHHLAHSPVHWIVLGALPRGPAWGATIEAGAAQVLRADTPLAEVLEHVRAAARDVAQGVVRPDDEREELLREWRAVRDAHEALLARLMSLSPREEYVLGRLHQGEAVLQIARRSGVSPATVRSQVKSMLRKLDVRSQLAAVAIYSWGHGDAAGHPAPLWAADPRGIPNFWETR